MGALSSRTIVEHGTPEAQWQSPEFERGLRSTALGALVPRGSRVVVVAPHPDDELLGCGGLLHDVLSQGQGSACVIAVTDGTASHPGSRKWTPGRLARVRHAESLRALRCLGLVDASRLRLAFTDGGLVSAERALAQRLTQLLRGDDVVVTTWRYDGHPDHEACARATGRACDAVGARLVEMPVWMWHWATPHDHRIPWSQLRRLPLSVAARDAKARAIKEARSQLEPDESNGRGPVLTPAMLAHWTRSWEAYFA